jgi:tRNA A-37 threonylcarbamoyl transferase component Bud32
VHGSESGDDLIERLVADGVGAGYQMSVGPVWVMVMPESLLLPEHGWKIHISSREVSFPELVQQILPALVAEGCAFKLARSQRTVGELNDGLSFPESVGKAVTIYPDQQRVGVFAKQLAELLRGFSGPRILSDRRVAPSAPVYYRYGPFTAGWESDAKGKLTLLLHGPDGETFDGTAKLVYQQPPWVTDPFTGAVGDEHSGGQAPDTLGGHYRVTGGISVKAQGNVYRATDLRDGGAVVIKQARALVAESRGEVDTRLRLRNERRVLQDLDGVSGVPRFLDHFRHADDEFLVTSDCGPANLAEDVQRHGPYRTGEPGGQRSLDTLAAGLARIVSDLHRRGVVIRDLSPKNVVIDGSGVSIIDFGIAAYNGLRLPGVTPGYAPPRQWRDELPAAVDDYFALGMTLLFATSGLDPVSLGEDPDLPRVRALQAIRSGHGETPAGVIGLIADLISDDERASRGAFRRLLADEPVSGLAPSRSLPAIATVTTEGAAEIAEVLLADLLKATGEILSAPPGRRDSHDVTVSSGTSGIGLELLQHRSGQRARQVLGELVTFTGQAAQRIRLPPGLFVGATGVSVFMQQAAATGIETLAATWRMPEPDWQPEGDDLYLGTAGVGLGHLQLYHASGDPVHLDVAMRCGRQIMTATTPMLPAAGERDPAAGTDPHTGRAHGLAGVTEFLLALAAQTADEAVYAAAARHARELARHTRSLLPQARQPSASPLAMSWCQGLAGIGPVLLQASAVLDDKSLASLAKEAADACIAGVPRFGTLGRCCGAAGVGSFLIDLAVSTEDERYWRAAQDVGTHLLLRSAGPPAHPVFVKDTGVLGGPTWSQGLAGLLSFFRRLARRGGPDSASLAWCGPRAAV